MDLAHDFARLTTKFLFLNCNDGQTPCNTSELDNILNDLNSLDYKGSWKSVDEKAITRLFDSFTHIEPSQGTLVVKACFLITLMLNKQKVKELTKEEFHSITLWFQQCIKENFSHTACEVLAAMQAMFKTHPQFANEYIDRILLQDGLLLEKLSSKNTEIVKGCNGNSFEEIMKSIVQCIDAMFAPVLDISSNNPSEKTESHRELIANIGNCLIDIMYSNCLPFKNSINHINFLTNLLKLLYKFAFAHQEWSKSHMGELLGIAKTYIYLGLSDESDMKPLKVHLSQQSVFDSLDTNTIDKCSGARGSGGKIAKTRKPRTVKKNTRKLDEKLHESPERITSGVVGTLFRIDYDIPSLLVATNSKTSDSEFSESEDARARNETHKQSKVRLAAISLISVLASKADKRIFYGYWHSLFPTSDAVARTNCGLLNCVLRDPNIRCRMAALQTATAIIYGSRPFLLQAESSEKVPTTFMPFSISLAQMIITIYEILTKALETENSLPVLTQILKCLTVLIQATPFHRLKSGFVESLVNQIRNLVYHKDSTVHTAALMVMEFLISTAEMTKEISQVIGIPKSSITFTARNQNKLNDSGIEEVIQPENFEENIESDESDGVKSTKSIENENQQIKVIPGKMSWLLQRVLENLEVIIIEPKEKLSLTPTPVRIESLQVLSSMSRHFSLLQSHLQIVAVSLKVSLCDNQPDVRLYAAKCLDNIGHAINTYLLENDEYLLSCQVFWAKLLPSVIKKIQDAEQSATLKSILCDFLSNIGVHIFERLSFQFRIKLISLLSGESCNEDNIVRAAAVRALAVYVLFPSLRDDLVFVENTAISAIDLIRNSNLFVRVKASWSMGNVSDALIKNCFDTRLDRVSDNLLEEMLKASIESTNDNDKIRSNIVRVLGNLLRLMTIDHLNQLSWRNLAHEAIRQLVKCMQSGGNSKVKWNSCYAIGNFMKNERLFNVANNFDDFNWPALVFPALCAVIINHSNFKVRTNGTAALVIVQERKYYGNFYQLVWSSLLDAMEQSDNLVDFNEYKHRDNLQEQLCIAISHIVRISVDDDLQMLKITLVYKLEIVKQIWGRVINRISPENSAPLLACSPLLREKLKKQNGNTDYALSREQQNAIEVLAECFAEPVIEFD